MTTGPLRLLTAKATATMIDALLAQMKVMDEGVTTGLLPAIKLDLACRYDPDWAFERAVMGDEWMLAHKTIFEINRRALDAVLRMSSIKYPLHQPLPGGAGGGP